MIDKIKIAINSISTKRDLSENGKIQTELLNRSKRPQQNLTSENVRFSVQSTESFSVQKSLLSSFLKDISNHEDSFSKEKSTPYTDSIGTWKYGVIDNWNENYNFEKKNILEENNTMVKREFIISRNESLGLSMTPGTNRDQSSGLPMGPKLDRNESLGYLMGPRSKINDSSGLSMSKHFDKNEFLSLPMGHQLNRDEIVGLSLSPKSNETPVLSIAVGKHLNRDETVDWPINPNRYESHGGLEIIPTRNEDVATPINSTVNRNSDRNMSQSWVMGPASNRIESSKYSGLNIDNDGISLSETFREDKRFEGRKDLNGSSYENRKNSDSFRNENKNRDDLHNLISDIPGATIENGKIVIDSNNLGELCRRYENRQNYKRQPAGPKFSNRSNHEEINIFKRGSNELKNESSCMQTNYCQKEDDGTLCSATNSYEKFLNRQSSSESDLTNCSQCENIRSALEDFLVNEFLKSRANMDDISDSEKTWVGETPPICEKLKHKQQHRSRSSHYNKSTTDRDVDENSSYSNCGFKQQGNNKNHSRKRQKHAEFMASESKGSISSSKSGSCSSKKSHQCLKKPTEQLPKPKSSKCKNPNCKCNKNKSTPKKCSAPNPSKEGHCSIHQKSRNCKSKESVPKNACCSSKAKTNEDDYDPNCIYCKTKKKKKKSVHEPNYSKSNCCSKCGVDLSNFCDVSKQEDVSECAQTCIPDECALRNLIQDELSKMVGEYISEENSCGNNYSFQNPNRAPVIIQQCANDLCQKHKVVNSMMKSDCCGSKKKKADNTLITIFTKPFAKTNVCKCGDKWHNVINNTEKCPLHSPSNNDSSLCSHILRYPLEKCDSSRRNINMQNNPKDESDICMCSNLPDYTKIVNIEGCGTNW